MTTDALPESPEPVDLLDTPGAAATTIRGSAMRTGGYVAVSLANALVLPFLFRYLGVIKAGQYVTVLSLMTILAGIVEVGLTGISVRLYTAAPRSERRRLLQNLLSMRIFVLAIGALIVLAFALGVGYPRVIVLGVCLGAVGVLFENIGSSYNVWLAANLHQGWIALSNVARQLVVAILTFGFVFTQAPLLAFFAAFIPAGLAQLFVSARVTRRFTSLLPSVDARAWLALTRRSATYVIAMALGFVYFRVPVILMSLLASGTETGYFGAAFRIVETLAMLTIVLTAALPILTRAATHDAARHFSGLARFLQVSVVIGGGLAVIAVTGARAAITIIAGPRFREAIGPLEALAPLLLLKFVTTAWSFGLLSVGRYRELLVANLVASATSVILGLIAIPLVGVYGGVIASLGAELLLAVTYEIVLRRSLSGASFPRRSGIVIGAAALVSCCTLLLPLPDVIRPLLGGLIYLSLVLVTRELPPETLDALPFVHRSRRV